MFRPSSLAAIAIMISGAATAQAPAKPLDAIGFLVGDWQAGQGQVAETGGTSRGRSTITREVGGAVLLRRDHTDLFSKDGKPQGGFDQIMMIYPEAGSIRADYSDGTHIIHYTEAEITPGHAVIFASASQPHAPTFRLRYELSDPRTLTINFQMAPPDSPTFRPIATGTLTRAP